MKKRDIVIDADHILFFVAKANKYKSGFDDECNDDDDCNWGNEVDSFDLEPYIEHFKNIIDDYILTAEVESICYKWTIGKVRVILSDSTNFRYGLYPEYKHNRKNIPKDEVLEKLKAWARKEYTVIKNCEADDVVAYYVRKGGIGFTTDKDLYKGVNGIWFNTHQAHRCWVRTSKEDADKFFKMQCLAGDSVDGIPALPRVGLTTAEKLMNKYGWDWDNMLKIYKDRGFDKKYFVTMVRLVCMSQWTPKKGIKLWKLKDILV